MRRGAVGRVPGRPEFPSPSAGAVRALRPVATRIIATSLPSNKRPPVRAGDRRRSEPRASVAGYLKADRERTPDGSELGSGNVRLGPGAACQEPVTAGSRHTAAREPDGRDRSLSGYPPRLATGQVEICFEWIQQHLRIKQFYGTTENAGKTQIWAAVSTYVLVAIVKKRLKIQASLYDMLQILSLAMFEPTTLNTLFAQIPAGHNDADAPNRMNLLHQRPDTTENGK